MVTDHEMRMEALRLFEENEKLRAAVLKYSTHTSDCRYRGGHDCDCGVEELRNKLQKK